MKRKAGTVTEIEFTFGSAGHQWTTIDNVRYATWWDIRNRNWNIGDRIEFDHYRAPLWHGQESIDCAQNIQKAKT